MKKLLVLVVVLVMAFAALPAFAQEKADWAFYGSVRMWTAWETLKAETPAVLTQNAAAPFLGLYGYGGFENARRWLKADDSWEGDSGLAWDLQGNSRIGANVKWGNVSGAFEYGSGPNLRLLYGKWNFGPGNLEIGQDYSPWFFLVSSLCGPGGGECNGIGFGSIYDGRVPQVRLNMGGFSFALVKPYALANLYGIDHDGNVGAFAPADIDKEFPKVEASYTFNAGPAVLWLGGAWQKVTYVTTAIGNLENDITINGWELGIGAKTAFGPFYLNGTAQYARNPNNMNIYVDLIPTFAWVDATAQNQEDATYWSFQLIPGFKLTDSFSVEGGIIYQSAKNNVPDHSTELKQNSWVYYIQATWSPAKNVYFVPEFGIIDYKDLEISGDDDDNVDLGRTTWFGIKWMINF